MQALSLSGDHFLPTGPAIGGSPVTAWDRRVMRRARDVRPGMLIWAIDGETPIPRVCRHPWPWRNRRHPSLTVSLACSADGGRTAPFRVGNVTTEPRTGLFNPFTATGTIVVDGVVASVQSKWFADDVMDALGLTHAVPALYQARARPSLLASCAHSATLTQSLFI